MYVLEELKEAYEEYGVAVSLCDVQKEISDTTYVYAKNLANTIWQKHYSKKTDTLNILSDTLGVLTQIDNMVSSMCVKSDVIDEILMIYQNWIDDENAVSDLEDILTRSKGPNQ